MKALARISVLAGLLALACLMTPGIGHAQNSRSCGWSLMASPPGNENQFGPDVLARDYLTTFDASHQTITIKGRSPHTRYLSFVAYDLQNGVPVDGAGHLCDSRIAADPGSGVKHLISIFGSRYFGPGDPWPSLGAAPRTHTVIRVGTLAPSAR